MILRILTGASLALLGYYIGREVGRAEPIRRELREARESENSQLDRPSSKTAPKRRNKPTANTSRH